MYIYIYTYIHTKVSQKFSDMRHNLAAPVAFGAVVKMTNHSGL